MADAEIQALKAGLEERSSKINELNAKLEGIQNAEVIADRHLFIALLLFALGCGSLSRPAKPGYPSCLSLLTAMLHWRFLLILMLVDAVLMTGGAATGKVPAGGKIKSRECKGGGNG